MAGGLGQIEPYYYIRTARLMSLFVSTGCFLFLFLILLFFCYFCILNEGRAISELARGDCQSYEFGAKAFALAWSFSLSPHQEFAVLGRS